MSARLWSALAAMLLALAPAAAHPAGDHPPSGKLGIATVRSVDGEHLTVETGTGPVVVKLGGVAVERDGASVGASALAPGQNIVLFGERRGDGSYDVRGIRIYHSAPGGAKPQGASSGASSGKAPPTTSGKTGGGKMPPGDGGRSSGKTPPPSDGGKSGTNAPYDYGPPGDYGMSGKGKAPSDSGSKSGSSAPADSGQKK